MFLMPSNHKFFELFQKSADLSARAATLLLELARNPVKENSRIAAIRELEHQGDGAIRDLSKLLLRSFITPFDREDIHLLSSNLDTILDETDEAAKLFDLMDIKTSNPNFERLVDLLRGATAELAKAVTASANKKPHLHVQKHTLNVADLESQADAVYNQALAELFRNEKDAVVILKWKQLLDIVENAVDSCQRAGNVLEMIVLKSA
jgi:predicted phosphate transport protein (TIGR00153 family)